MVHSFIERRMREVRGGLAGDQLADPREKQEKEKKKRKNPCFVEFIQRAAHTVFEEIPPILTALTNGMLIIGIEACRVVPLTAKIVHTGVYGVYDGPISFDMSSFQSVLHRK